MFKFLNTPTSYPIAKQIMLEAYETFYGIYDHLNSPHPFALLRRKESEETFDGRYNIRLREFLNSRVYERLGISFDAFLNRPGYMIDKLLEGLARHDEERMPPLNELGDKIDALGKL